MGDPIGDFAGVHPGDIESAGALIADRLGLGRSDELRPIGEGDFCFAFLCGDRVIRVAKHAAAAAALRTEACVLSRIADRLPVPVPRPEFAAPREGFAFSVHRVLAGEVLTRELWLEMPVRQRERTTAELAEFLLVLHGIPVNLASHCALNRVDLAEPAGSLYGEVTNELLPLLDRAVGATLLEFLARCADADARPRYGDSLIHCDIAPGHVLIDRAIGRVAGIIDFGDVAVGDPARDFIYIYEDFGPEILGAVLAHYERDAPGSLLPRIRQWYLLETVDWTVKMLAIGSTTEVWQGVREILRELSNPGLERG